MFFLTQSLSCHRTHRVSRLTCPQEDKRNEEAASVSDGKLQNKHLERKRQQELAVPTCSKVWQPSVQLDIRGHAELQPPLGQAPV